MKIMYQNYKGIHQFSVNFISEIFSQFKVWGVFCSIEMIPVNDSQYEKWDLFENAATYSYARSVLEKNKNKEGLQGNDEKSRRNLNTNEYVQFLGISIIES